MSNRPSSVRLALLCAMSLLLSAYAQNPKDLIKAPIDDRATAPVPFSVHPKARALDDAGLVPADLRVPRMTMVLRRGPAQEAELQGLLAAQQSPQSPDFHKWLSPEEFGRRFGLSQNDLDKLTAWLTQYGFIIDDIPAGRWTIVFTGTAGQVQSAFRTELHYFTSGGVRHRANSIPLQLPQALSGIVEGILNIDDFKPVHTGHKAAAPAAGFGSSHYLLPADYGAIYNLNPLYSQKIDGTGQTIAIVGECVIDPAVVQTFRALTGLGSNNTIITPVSGQLPLPCSSGETGEPYLDVEWAGAVAKGATVNYVVATNIDDSASYIVNHNLAPVMSTSYGGCESHNLGGGNQFWSGLWQQAASSGITSLVSSGDSGAAGCDNPNTAATAVGGLQVNAICSSPYDVCVGGTEFLDSSNPSTYWSVSGGALGKIPEDAWNESASNGGSGLWSSGGGYSTVYPKTLAPWQSGNTSAWRGVPDVSLTSAGHDGYFVCDGVGCTLSNPTVYEGTSAASPSFAGIMALVVQKTGQRQGNANLAALYLLASRSDVFRDVVTGNNSVPGQNGYSAGIGWDPVTGLGSVDANALVTNWGTSPSANPSLLLSANSLAFGNQVIGNTSPSLIVTVTNNGNAAVNITSILLQGADSGDFPTTTTCPKPGSLSAGQSCTLTVGFKPVAAGARTASVQLVDNAPTSPQTVSFSGTGITAAAPPMVLDSLTSAVSGISNGFCSKPATVAGFTTTSPAVWLYFDLNGANIGDTAKINFVRPDGVIYASLTSTSNYAGYECFSFYEQLSGASAVSYLGKWTIQGYWNQFAAPIFSLNFTVSAPPANSPVINTGGIVNSATQTDGTTSGGFISIYGTNLSTQGIASWNVVNNKLPTTTGGSEVLIDGKLAYLSYVSPTLINAIVPVDSTVGSVSVQVVTAVGASPAITVNKKAIAPGLFTIAQGGARYAIATLPDGTLALPAGLLPASAAVRGAKPGDTIALWASGLGPTSPAYPDGQVVTVQNRGTITSPYSVLIGGKPAVVQYAGLVGAGLYQVNVVVPQVAAGDASIVMTVAGVVTQNLYVYIGQ